MKINRTRLANELSILEPAIADKPEIPGLDLLWFDGETVIAYDGTIGIKKPLETDFTGGLFGKILIGYLEKITSDEVELGKVPKIEDFEISAGQSNLRLPLSQIENRLWDLPDYDPNGGFMMTKDFLNLVEFCLVSINKNTAIAEQTGLTLEATKTEINLYTTDAVTMCWGRLSKPKNYAYDRLCIPGVFWEQVLKICGPEDNLYLSPTSAIAVNRTGTTLYGRILDIEAPLPFQARVEQWISEIDFDLISIPPDLDAVLSRAELLRQGRTSEPAQFTIKHASGPTDSPDNTYGPCFNDTINLYLKTPLGELKDDLNLDDGHPEVVAMLDPAHIKRALAERTLFAMNKQRLIMTGPPEFMHIISTMHK